jgi:chitosanase
MQEIQKKVARAIVNIFETGSPLGRYGSVAVIPGDSGHLTYGRSQTTLASGNLALLIRAYCDADGAECSDELRAYLGRLAARDLSLDNDQNLKGLLRRAGDDSVMRSVQDDFFDRAYWVPAETHAQADSIVTPLGTAVVYDSHVHGSWGRIRAMTGGTAQTVGEKTWIAKYVETRRQWLATHANPVLHKTVYRMVTFQKLIDADNWDLALAITVMGIVINEATFEERHPGSAEDPDETNLSLEDPPLRGERVSRLQEALQRSGISIDVDGVFGKQTDAAVRLFQSQRQLTVDGVVGPATRAALGI